MRNLFFLICILFICNGDAQNNMQYISNEALLIRLNTNTHLIKYYLENNEFQKYESEKNKQKDYNNQIIDAFRNYYSFAPVYFFYSHFSSDVKQGKLDSIFDVNGKTLKYNEIQKIKNQNYNTGYFGLTKGTLKFHALILNDKNLNTTNKPSIKNIRTYRGLGPFKRGKNRVVQILQKKQEFKTLGKQ